MAVHEPVKKPVAKKPVVKKPTTVTAEVEVKGIAVSISATQATPPKVTPKVTPKVAPKVAPKKAVAKKVVDKPAPKVYTVKSGDTLGKIARANNTTVSLLQKINGIKNANAISIGQKIKLS